MIVALFCLAPGVPQNLQLQVQGPSGNTRPQMTVTWGKPVDKNGFIRKYTLVFSYTLDQKKTSIEISTNGQTSSYSFDVLGGIQYDVELWAETIKPGPKATSFKQIPVYSKCVFHVSSVTVVLAVAVEWYSSSFTFSFLCNPCSS